MGKNLFTPNGDYDTLLQGLKERIRTAQIRAALSVNQELVMLYWSIGNEILNRQQQQGWGTKVITQLAKDLSHEFSEMKGFSVRNLKYMRAFAEAYQDKQIVQQLVAQIPWGHNVRLLDTIKDLEERLWYIQKTIENSWSRNVMLMQIESKLFQRQGGSITNFKRTLPHPQSDIAQSIIKDPYNFNFLTLTENAQERDLEKALVDHIRDFLLELGTGFSFVGSQYHLDVGGEDFYIDLLFFHLQLRCFIVIDLKMGDFRPEYSGKMNFYVSAIDNLLRHPTDNPTIGIILCKSKNKTIAEYALQDVNKPIGISTHRIGDELPAMLKERLPSIEQLETELDTIATTVEREASTLNE